ncbi:MAG TPA: SurA N-terminal domain-containing protein [Thermodesulfovibrionales bacterium]|nr:SurA N-terminal domain-containing protein [Thermodesulfovibrionales bacterium]
MLKAMRKHAKFFYVLFFIVILSFIFWGVGTVDKSTAVPVAEVGKSKITLEEYWSAYDRAREFYRNVTKGAFTEEMEKQLDLKQRVLDALIEDAALLAAARKMGIQVSDAELEEAITNDPPFMRDGKFNKEVYLRSLQLNRMTPEYYEAMKRKELILAKVRRLIGESVDLSDEANAPSDPQMRSALLAQMRDNAVKSYVEGLKKQMKVKVNRQLLG